MEAVVLHRVGFLEYFCPKQGQDFKPSAAPIYPNMGKVPPPPPRDNLTLINLFDTRFQFLFHFPTTAAPQILMKARLLLLKRQPRDFPRDTGSQKNLGRPGVRLKLLRSGLSTLRWMFHTIMLILYAQKMSLLF